jgi:hypothetical protein
VPQFPASAGFCLTQINDGVSISGGQTNPLKIIMKKMNRSTRRMFGYTFLFLAFAALICSIGYLWRNNAALPSSTIAYILLGAIAIKVTATLGIIMAFGKFKTDGQPTLASS